MRAPVTFPALGTTAVLLTEVEGALDLARATLEAEIAAIDSACSRFRDDSDLSRVNAAAGAWVATSPRFIEALDVALRAARITDGLVDPTIGTAMRILGYDRDFGRVDRTGPALSVTVQRVAGWRTIEVDRRSASVRVPRGVALDFGATAKALCADRAARAIGRATGTSVLVGLGGDVAIGGPPRAQGWAVAIADNHITPAAEADEHVVVRAGGVATSGTTARRWMRGDRVLHHVLDPQTGQPVREVWRTVSVNAGTCVDANIASTAAVILGAGAPKWLEARGLPARLVGADDHITYVGSWPEPTRSLAC